MKDFFTTNQTQPPEISFFHFALMILVLIGLGGLSYHYRNRRRFRNLFKGIQLVQIICLYFWYTAFKLPLTDSLPLYHCRLAMFGILFLPDKWPLKQYLAILGVSGSVFALSYPVMDPYDFPHITAFSYLVGHYALFVNGLVYLFNHYQPERLSEKRILVYTLGINLLLIGANQITGGNYGFLQDPPLIDDYNLLINYLAVNLVLITALFLVNARYRWWYARREAELV